MSTSLFSKTPTVTVLDNRGLTVRNIAYDRHPESPDITRERITRHQYDARGFLTQSADPRLHDAGLANFSYLTDLAGSVLRTVSVDAGTTVALNDAAGRPFIAVSNIGTADDGTEDLSQAVTRTREYEDAALPGRLVSVTEQVTGEAARITERFVYAGNTDKEKALNLAGSCVSHYDTAGLTQTDSVALTGVLLSVTRRLLKDADNPDAVADWQDKGASVWNTRLGEEVFTTLTIADATGAVLTTTDARGNMQRLAYDVAGLLSGSWLTLKGSTEQVIVKSLTYSAAGQKLREEHGNGVVTTYTYEPETQRLTGIKTARPAGHPSGAKVLQDLRYEYDPVGNVLKVTNDAEETRFWRNQKVVPENAYAYDSLYQLVCATGREMASAGQQCSSLPSATVSFPTDGSAFTNYSRTYTYDTGGNLTQISHNAPATGNNYTTDITVSSRSNRGVLSVLTENPAEVDALFTAGGQQKQLQPGQGLVWTVRNELLKVSPVQRDGDTDDRESYRYDGSSQRVLKVSVQKTNSSTQTQRALYLPGLELRSTKAGDTVTENLQVVTVGEAGRAQVRMLHWTGGKPGDISNDQVRYSYDNLTGSSGLELDGDGSIISTEEYYPYGGTAVWAARSQLEADYKAIRYSGKERDATGLYYYGYRYYQPWAGRWLSADPAGTVDGMNLFRMVRNNPIAYHDDQGLSPVRTHFDEKDIEGFASIFNSIKQGLSAGGMSPDETVFVMVGRSPQILGEYISESGFSTAILQVSGLGNNAKMTNFNSLSDEEKNNRNKYLQDSLSKSFANKKNAILLDYSVTGNSILETFKMVKEHYKDNDINIKMAIITRYLDNSDLNLNEKESFHHADNLLYDGENGKGLLNYNNRGVMRTLKILHHEIDKSLSYTEKFPYTKIDTGEKPGIIEAKKANLNGMMKVAMSQHGSINYTDIKNRNKNRFMAMVNKFHPKYSSHADYINSYNFKRSYVGSFLYGIKKYVTGYRS
ncbi:RHS repeat-associated core domain-containing protein [Enterobacter cloacae]|uniref:RHS repeat-associated core domain-containing protein n=1 Tax=Enterobacter cloacae TaxID=550 RepID=UPI003D20A333